MLRGILVGLVDGSPLRPGQQLRGNIGTSTVSTAWRGGDSERRNATTEEFIRSGTGFVFIWAERIRVTASR